MIGTGRSHSLKGAPLRRAPGLRARTGIKCKGSKMVLSRNSGCLFAIA